MNAREAPRVERVSAMSSKGHAAMERGKMQGEEADKAAKHAIHSLRCIGELLQLIGDRGRSDDGAVPAALVEWLGDRAGWALSDVSEWIELQHGHSW